jgi:hypothetical protein
MFAVFLDLGTLVAGNGVFQREFVQAEFLAQPGDSFAVRRFQFDPDEAVWLGTCSLMSSNAIAWTLESWKSRQSMMAPGSMDDGVSNSSP